MEPRTIASPPDLFIKELRRALNHLYDPDFLRSSALAGMLGVNGRFDTPTTLQSLLIRTIESLKPAPGAPNKSHAQATYDLLLYRYVQQFNQDEIANQLGISVRHLRRQQNQVVEELACVLWNQIQAETSNTPPENTPASSTTDLDWLRGPFGEAITDLINAIEEVRVLIQPFIEQRNTVLVFPTCPDKALLVHPVAFQQILLSLLSAILQQNARQLVRLNIQEASGWIILEIQSSGTGNQPQELDIQTRLASVEQMASLSGGRFEYRLAGSLFYSRVSFRVADQVNVLVIDDNPEIITMMERFTAGTRYRVLGLNDPKLAVEQALSVKPNLIVLDIMMPQIDGLHVLSRIKHHPALHRLPVVICSVLPQKDLAESLGASVFIKKPIQREAFLQALNQATSENNSESL